MGCRVVNLPGEGRAIVCGPRLRKQPEPKPCVSCGKPSTALCDWRISPDEDAKRRKGQKRRKDPTCDAALCDEHRYRIGPNRDLCPPHRERHEKWVTRQPQLPLEDAP